MTNTTDYKETLFLPTTEFPMRAGLPKQEPEHLKRWKEMGLFDQLRKQSADEDRKPFILHDGPPYANGHLHIGHALNKILKDLIIRSKQMAGFDAHYIPGWDCHGLPIEWKVEEGFRGKGRKKADVPASEFREACRKYAAEWIAIQSDEFQRFGIEGNWKEPYKTMNFQAEADIVREFMKIVEKGMVFQGSKPVMWSPVEQTALAEAEIEYHDHQSTTIWVKFPFKQGTAPDDLADASVVIWTTTPWTIPANRAVCYGPTLKYGLYEVTEIKEGLEFEPWYKPGDKLILSDALAETVQGAALVGAWNRLRDVSSDELGAATCEHPLKGHGGGYEFDVPLLAGDHVTDEAGTGFVHTAPSHGPDDYFAWLGAGLPLDAIPAPVGPDGAYTEDAPGFVGETVMVTEGKKKGRDGSANGAVIAELIVRGALFARGRMKHSYPHSWRSKAPVIYRNTPQWFVRLDGDTDLRSTALKAIDETKFYPQGGQKRLRTMIENRPDWLVSRQRAWGVPITIFAHKETGEPLQDEAVNARIYKAVAEKGADAWFDTSAQDFLGAEYKAEDYIKVEDILDVWFDSGSTHAFCLERRAKELRIEDRIANNQPTADLYLEGTDQHRGWFHSSLLESCATRGHAPYQGVLTHGFTMDEKGFKMSKSSGNSVDPAKIIQQYGADILRIWVTSSDVFEDQRIGKEIIGSAVDSYRKLRNTLRYLLGALNGYTDEEAVAFEVMPELEQYMLHRLAEVDAKVRAAYEVYDFKVGWRILTDFCSNDLSSFYLDIRKDSLYCDAPANPERRAARHVMNTLLNHHMHLLAPVCVFTMEETFLSRYPDQKDASIHLQKFAPCADHWTNDALVEKWSKIRDVRRVVTGALEIERREKRIGASLEAAPTVFIEDADLLGLCETLPFADMVITSSITLEQGSGPQDAFRLDDVTGVCVSPTKAEGRKCERCWRILPEVTETKKICTRCNTVVTALEVKGG